MIPNHLLEGINRLDPLPATARRLTAMLGDESVNLNEIAKVVEYDAAVAANIIRVANSAAWAGRYPIDQVRDAVVRLGTVNLLTIILGDYMRIFKASAPLYDLSEDDLYLHSAAASLMIRAIICQIRSPLPPSTSIAALLHDIGKLIMVRYMKADVSALQNLCKEKKITFVEAEREVLGCDHAEVGGAIARNWGFPPDIILGIERHHHVIRGGSGIVLDAVMLADYGAKSIGLGLGAGAFNMPMDFEGSRQRLGLSIEGFERACAQVALWMVDQKQTIAAPAL
jgi:putative nucleotidyltransferase with HDIG domain